jgi:hypothetical protein
MRGSVVVWLAGVAIIVIISAASLGQDWKFLLAADVIALGVLAWAAAMTARLPGAIRSAFSAFRDAKDPEALNAVSGEAGELLAPLREGVAALSKDAVFFGGAIRAANNPLLVCDRQGKIVFATKSLLEILRKPAKPGSGPFGEPGVLQPRGLLDYREGHGIRPTPGQGR